MKDLEAVKDYIREKIKKREPGARQRRSLVIALMSTGSIGAYKDCLKALEEIDGNDDLARAAESGSINLNANVPDAEYGTQRIGALTTIHPKNCKRCYITIFDQSGKLLEALVVDPEKKDGK